MLQAMFARSPEVMIEFLMPCNRWCVPDNNVSLSNNPRGDRVAVVNYSRGQRAGIYTFTAGRLTSIERAPEAGAPARGAKPKKKPAA